MIKSIQSAERVNNQPLRKFSGNEVKNKVSNSPAKSPELQAAELKYGLACLWMATSQFGDTELKQKMANAMAHKNYCETCLK